MEGGKNFSAVPTIVGGGHVPYLTILNVSGHCDLVRIEGGANAISLNAEGFTMVDLTIHGPRFHAIQVRGERGIPPTGIYNVHLLDAGQQFIKTSTGDGTN